nr:MULTISPECIES: hypothetical protein [Pseudomonas]
MGCRRPPHSGHPARRRHTCVYLQPVWPRHRRTRRARADHPLRIRRQPAPRQPRDQSRRQPTALPLRQLATQPHRDRKRARRTLSTRLLLERPDPAGNRFRWSTHRVRVRPQRPTAEENRVR